MDLIEDPTTCAADDAPGHILLVEDYAPNILVTRLLIESFGHHMTVAVNGEEALARIRESRDDLDVVLMDVQMPDMDGFEVTRRIRLEEQSGNLPPLAIIAMTAHALHGDRQRCLAAGMDDYIPKPFRPEELESALHTFIRRARETRQPKAA